MGNILLVEDHNIVRNGIKTLLLNEPDFNVIGEAVNGKSALEMLDNGLVASTVITDINMPDMNGLELTEIVKDKFPGTKVVVLTMLNDENYIHQAFAAGASAYLLKTVGLEELVFALRHIRAGHSYICSELALMILTKNKGFYSVNTSLNSAVSLSPREAEVLKLVAIGHTNSEIAEKLFTSKRTVEGHRQKLLSKTGTKNTAALIRFAIQNKFLN